MTRQVDEQMMRQLVDFIKAGVQGLSVLGHGGPAMTTEERKRPPQWRWIRRRSACRW
jgi:dihydrodipicolinate synthase/N-acetylneuraminate lyase